MKLLLLSLVLFEILLNLMFYKGYYLVFNEVIKITKSVYVIFFFNHFKIKQKELFFKTICTSELILSLSSIFCNKSILFPKYLSMYLLVFLFLPLTNRDLYKSAKSEPNHHSLIILKLNF